MSKRAFIVTATFKAGESFKSENLRLDFAIEGGVTLSDVTLNEYFFKPVMPWMSTFRQHIAKINYAKLGALITALDNPLFSRVFAPIIPFEICDGTISDIVVTEIDPNAATANLAEARKNDDVFDSMLKELFAPMVPNPLGKHKRILDSGHFGAFGPNCRCSVTPTAFEYTGVILTDKSEIDLIMMHRENIKIAERRIECAKTKIVRALSKYRNTFTINVTVEINNALLETLGTLAKTYNDAVTDLAKLKG